MKKLILFVMLISGFMAARADFASPDFAFPQTVIQDAEAHLKTAQGLSRMKAVMEIVTAKSSIDRDSLYQMPVFIGSIAKSERDAKVRGLMLLYEANTLNRIYGQNRWKFDRVQAPLLPLPSNPAEWSGEQFKYSVRQLTDSAITILKPYFKTPLTDYKEVVKLDDVSPEFYPYLRDFLYNQAINYERSDDKSYLTAITDMCEPGTAEWAVWIVRNNSEYNFLIDTYKKYPDGVCGGYLLWNAVSKKMYETFPDDYDNIVSLLKAYFDKQPANIITSTLKSQYEVFTSPTCTFKLPDYAMSGATVKIPFKYANTGKIGLKISRMSPQTGNNTDNAVFYKNVIDKVDKVSSVKIDTLSFTVDEPGRYYLELICDGDRTREGNIVIFTPWSPFLLIDKGKCAFMVPEYDSGAPVRDASISMYMADKKQFKLLGKTNYDGILIYDLPDELIKKDFSYPVQITGKDGKKVYYGNQITVYNYVDNFTDRVAGSMFVDRPAYHPGDTVNWSVVMAVKNEGPYKAELLKDKELKVIFYDANHTPIDTIQCTTDRYGRASGEFAIPENLLSGRFSISTRGKGYHISAPVMVSDFKAPVFELRDVQVVKSGADYIVEGRAQRYSGASVPDAEVKVDLSSTLYYTFWNPGWGEIEATFTGVTEADGSFKVTIPADSLTHENYRCEVVVTSQSADIAEETVCFRAGKPYLLIGETNDKAINLDTPIKLDIFAYGSNLKNAALTAKWQLADDAKKVVSEGTCQIDSLGATFDFANVPVGQYSLSICPTDTTMFDTLEAGKVQLYSVKQNKIPSSLALVSPVKTYEITSKDKKVDINIGVPEESFVYVVTGNRDDRMAISPYKLKAGFNKITIEVESTIADQVIQLHTVKNGELKAKGIFVKRKASSKKLVLKGESWRDRLVPGATEQWRLKLSAENGEAASGALVATMYNHALDALATLSWPNDLQMILQPKANLFWNTISFLTNHDYTSYYRMRNRYDTYLSMVEPYFLYNVFDSHNVYGPIKMRAAGGRELVVQECSPSEESVNATYDMAAPMASAKEAEFEKTEADAGEAEGSTQEEFRFRAAETLQAFWMPSLTIDDNGEVTLNFVVPNAIGAWSFRATAWTEDCRAASMLATLTASKPVMVQPTLPRFMRRGDRLTVLATVMNNTDSVITAATTIELFNPADGKVLSTVNTSSEIAAKGQTLVPCALEAPMGLSNIGYRVKSTDGNFTDGEQALIPILEATTTAIDSELFYLTPSDSVFTAKIPADLSGKGIVAVQYCQNPVWDVVRALPGLYDFEPETAAGASASAYAAMVAKGLLGQFPEIRNVLDIWQSNPADSAFVSKLYKNVDLKLALLAQTPFVGSANAMSDQMQRLALTFDEKTINKVLDTSVSKLAALQRSDGGFAWGSWSNESSPWITRTVLATIGRLQYLGYKITDKKLLTIIDRAFGYIDSQVDIEDYGYTFIYSLYPDRKPSKVKGRQSIERVKQRIIANWKKSTTARKATDALILDALGNKAVARNIMSSVKQFAQSNAKRGTSFGSVLTVDAYSLLLEAFARITPDDKAIIDGMRQWLILQTQANDDLFAFDPTTLVAAILSTGSRWTAIPTGSTAAVTVDGTPLALSKVEEVTGAFSQRLAPSASQRVLRVARPEGSPVSYGSLVTVATQPMASVKPRECDGISITKRFLVERDGKWVETERFTLGERVRVQLLVKASRNMEYITINDDRPSAFEPVDRMPGWIFNAGTPAAYRENSDTRTRLFIYTLPKGTYYYTYDMTATFTGSFASGAATFQSQYAPELTARSGASTISVAK